MKLLLQDITIDQFADYEAVRQSGVTNMLDVKRVSELSGLDLDVILYIIKHYSDLLEKFAGEL